MFVILISVITLVSAFQVALTAAVGGQQSSLEHPFHGNVSCSSVCPPQKSGDNDILFCQDNCPDYWSWVISVIFADSSGLMNWASDCTEYNFTHVPSNSVIRCSNYRKFTNATENVKRFWSRNCVLYLHCMIWKNIDVLSGRSVSPISATTSPSTHQTAILSSEQSNQLFLLPVLIVLIVLVVLCVALCGGMIALRRWTPCQDQKVKELQNEVGLRLLTRRPSDQPTPVNPAEPVELSHNPIQETTEHSMFNELLSTVAKQTYFSPEENRPISLHSAFATPLSPCNSLRFNYQHPGNSSVSWRLCVDICPPTKNSAAHKQFCCTNCQEYCSRCLHSSSTNPSEMRGHSSTSNSHLHLTKSSSTSAEISTNVATKEILERQLETYRQEKVEWQQKEIVYIAVIACLVFGLIFAIAAFLVCYNLPTHKPIGSNSESRNDSEISDTRPEKQELLKRQQLDRKTPVENDATRHNSSLCAFQPNNSLTNNRTANQVLNPDNNTTLKEIDASSHCRNALMSLPHTLHEDSLKHSIMVTECNSCSELQAM